MEYVCSLGQSLSTQSWFGFQLVAGKGLGGGKQEQRWCRAKSFFIGTNLLCHNHTHTHKFLSHLLCQSLQQHVCMEIT